MARLDEWLSIINPLVSAGARAPELLDALELDVNAARYLASVATGAGQETRSYIRNRKLNVIRRYLRETLPAREDTARLQLDLAALRRLQREAGYQKRLQKHREREGLAGFDAPVLQQPKPLGAASVPPPALAMVPAGKTLAVGTPGSDDALMTSSARIARDLANAKRTVEIDPELAKLL